MPPHVALTGAYVGGICATLFLASVVYFFFGGGKEAFDRWAVMPMLNLRYDSRANELDPRKLLLCRRWRLTDVEIKTTLIAEKPSRGGVIYGTPSRGTR